MGNACTNNQKRTILVPSRVIQVQKNVFHDKADRNIGSVTTTNNRGEASTRPPSEEESGKNDQQPSPENEEEVKTSTALKPLPFKYNLSELGIGEYYLEKEFAEAEIRSSETDKKHKIQDYSKWDNTIVKLRVKIPQTSQDQDLYNYIDLCFQAFAESKPKGYKKLLKKGIPARYRWSIWKNHAKINQFYQKGLYEKLKGLSSRWEYDIKKDLHRTFPHEPYFASERYERLGQDHLFNVLKAVSLYLPSVGYAQSMNFVAAFLLLVNGGNEAEAFWMFITIARDHRFLLMGMFEKDFPLLEFYTYIFYEILEEELPVLYQHLRENQIPDLLWLFKWFLTIFLYSFPGKQVIKIWDFIMTHGLFSMIQIAIGILKVLEAEMLNLDTFGIDMLFKYLKGEPPVRPKSQTIPDNETEPAERRRNIQKKGTVILNHPSQPDIENQNSIHQGQNETSEIQFSFKQFKINEALDFAEKIHLTPEKISSYTAQYTSKTNKKLPSIYEKIFMDWHSFIDDPKKIEEFQTELNYHLMRSELSIKEVTKKTKKPAHEVFVTFVDEAEAEVVLIAGIGSRGGERTSLQAGASSSPIMEPESASVGGADPESAATRGVGLGGEIQEFSLLQVTTF